MSIFQRKKKPPSVKRRGKGSTSFLDVQTRKPMEDGRVGNHLALIVIALVTMLLLGWLVLQGLRSVSRTLYAGNDRFQMVPEAHHFRTSPEGILTLAQVMRIADIPESGNLFGFDLRQSRRKLLAMPAVEQARLRRVLPSSLDIEIVERTPVALLRKKRLLVDGEGMIVRVVRVSKDMALPAIVGFDSPNQRAGLSIRSSRAQDAVDVLNTIRESPFLPRFLSVKQIDVSSLERLSILLESGVRILLPRERYDTYLAQAAHFIDNPRGRAFRELDFTNRGQLIVR